MALKIWSPVLKQANSMETTEVFTTSQTTTDVEYSSTTETTDKFNLSDYLLKNYMIIILPSVFACIFLIILFIILIRKIMNRGRFNPKLLETYASVNYDDEALDEELGTADDLMYTSCKLLVGGDYEETPELTNSEPEYDCMSVDVTVSANESSIVEWDKSRMSQGATQNVTRGSTTLPRNFWRN